MSDSETKSLSLDAPEVMTYRDGFNNLVWIIKVLALGIFVMTAVLFYYISSVLPQDRYAALTGVDGETVVRMVGLRQPNITNEALLSWAVQAAADVMTFGFHDIDQRFAQSRTYFSDEGWRSFSEALSKSFFLKTMMESQQITTAIPRGPPELVHAGLYKGQFTWIVSVPLLMTIRAGSVAKHERMVIRMFIVRMPTQNNPMGIGINTWRGG